ncbi:MAG: hypothetical protein HXX81_00895, partial [Campylobacterales bacterium]|nr:hypothetical protein [Campylobacterales bacterium]
EVLKNVIESAGIPSLSSIDTYKGFWVLNEGGQTTVTISSSSSSSSSSTATQDIPTSYNCLSGGSCFGYSTNTKSIYYKANSTEPSWQNLGKVLDDNISSNSFNYSDDLKIFDNSNALIQIDYYTYNNYYNYFTKVIAVDMNATNKFTVHDFNGSSPRFYTKADNNATVISVRDQSKDYGYVYSTTDKGKSWTNNISGYGYANMWTTCQNSDCSFVSKVLFNNSYENRTKYYNENLVYITEIEGEKEINEIGYSPKRYVAQPSKSYPRFDKSVVIMDENFTQLSSKTFDEYPRSVYYSDGKYYVITQNQRGGETFLYTSINNGSAWDKFTYSITPLNGYIPNSVSTSTNSITVYFSPTPYYYSTSQISYTSTNGGNWVLNSTPLAKMLSDENQNLDENNQNKSYKTIQIGENLFIDIAK